jgi:hypothetical protein
MMVKIVISLGTIWLLLTIAALHEKFSFLLSFVPYESAINSIEWRLYVLNLTGALMFLGTGFWLSWRRGRE